MIPRLYKELLQMNNKKTTNQLKRWAKELNTRFSTEDMKLANRHTKIFNIISHEVNTNHNHNEIPLPNHENGHEMLVKMWKNWNLPTLPVGM